MAVPRIAKPRKPLPDTASSLHLIRGGMLGVSVKNKYIRDTEFLSF